jgi:HAE1 family hydrophobic/amphiphilic exporter-1
MLMFISDFAIKRPVITVVSMLAIVVFGLFALSSVKTDEFPDIQQPLVVVSIPYPGASPQGVEREVLDPVEEAVSGISGIDKIQSTAQDGFAQLIVFFQFEKDIRVATQEIRDEISRIRDQLPVEMKEPILTRFDPADQPIVSLTLSSESMTPAELTRIADPGITKDLKGITGVAQVNVVGGVEREMTIELRPSALQANGVSVSEVVQALQFQNLAAPVGRVTGTIDERTIRLRGRLEGPGDFAALVVAKRGDRLVRLSDVANVYDGSEESRTLALFNGRQAVGIDIVKSRGYSTTAVSDAIHERIDVIQKRMPPSARLAVVQDAGERVRNSVRNVEEALLEGALLTVLVVFLFLNSWRSTVITGLALPISALAAFIAVWAFGFTLNTMSLLGLTLAIGILIDDAIVVRENIVRHIEMGKDHYTASREATDEIGLAVTATTFSIICVFVPIAFMYGVAGQWFKPFALTIACAVAFSLLVSFSLDPMLSAYWADPQIEAHERRNPIARMLDRFNAWFDRKAEAYKGVIAWALDHRTAMFGLAVVSFFGAIGLQFMFGRSGFVPDSDRSEINIGIETMPGANLEYTRVKAEEAARLVRAHKEVKYTYTTIGGSSGAVNEGNIYVRLVPKADRSVGQGQLGGVIRQEVATLGGAKYSVFTSGFGGNFKQIQLELRGTDAVRLTQLAEQVASEMRQVKGAVDVGLSNKGQKPELEITLNRGLAGVLGVTVGQVAQALRPAFAGIDAGDWVDPSGETRNVMVRLAPDARRRASDLEQLPITVIPPTGIPTTMPLGQIATVRQGMGPAQINHLDRERVVNVQANTSGRSLGEVMTDINARLDNLVLPPGYRITQGGEAADQAEVFTRIFTALGVAVLLMYLILVMQFGSFLDPIAIMLSLPLSLIGVVVALLITRDSLNIMSLIGVILLMGIVAKNAILLIDFAKWGREQGMDRRTALIEAGRIRLRPIMMTTFALIAGMIPVALGIGEGADFRAPLGRAVIGGVITSTVLTLVVIPTVYEVLDEFKEWTLGKFAKRLHRPDQHAGAAPVPEAGD